MVYATYQDKTVRVLRRAKNRSRIQYGDKIIIVKTTELKDFQDVRFQSDKQDVLEGKKPA